MSQPLPEFDILGLRGQCQEVAFDRTLCVFLIQELLRFLFDVCILLTVVGRHRGGVREGRHRRCLLEVGRLRSVVLGLEILGTLRIAPSEPLTTDFRLALGSREVVYRGDIA